MEEEKIIAFLQGKTSSGELTYDTELMKSGLVNSLFALEIVMFVEKTFNIKLKRKDIKPENFSTVRRIAELVRRVKEGK